MASAFEKLLDFDTDLDVALLDQVSARNSRPNTSVPPLCYVSFRCTADRRQEVIKSYRPVHLIGISGRESEGKSRCRGAICIKIIKIQTVVCTLRHDQKEGLPEPFSIGRGLLSSSSTNLNCGQPLWTAALFCRMIQSWQFVLMAKVFLQFASASVCAFICRWRAARDDTPKSHRLQLL